jgi:biopolymer transport protein ExbD
MVSQEDLPVVIQADQAVPSGLLVRVIDAAKLGGALKVSVATAAKGS